MAGLASCGCHPILPADAQFRTSVGAAFPPPPALSAWRRNPPVVSNAVQRNHSAAALLVGHSTTIPSPCSSPVAFSGGWRTPFPVGMTPVAPPGAAPVTRTRSCSIGRMPQVARQLSAPLFVGRPPLVIGEPISTSALNFPEKAAESFPIPRSFSAPRRAVAEASPRPGGIRMPAGEFGVVENGSDCPGPLVRSSGASDAHTPGPLIRSCGTSTIVTCSPAPNSPIFNGRMKATPPRTNGSADSEGQPWCGSASTIVSSVFSRTPTPRMADAQMKATPSRVPRRESPPRFESLYQDHKLRMSRQRARLQDKGKAEELKLQQQRRESSVGRGFDGKAFNEWYTNRLKQHKDMQVKHAKIRSSKRRDDVENETAQCTFCPRSASPKRLGAVSADLSTGAVNIADGSVNPKPLYEQVSVDQMATDQAQVLQSLQRTCAKEQSARESVQIKAIHGFNLAAEESRRKILVFAETAEGTGYLAERARRYLELNQGMDEKTGWAQALEDLAKASETRLRAQTETALSKQLQLNTQQWLLARMQLLLELVQVQRRYRDYSASTSVSNHLPGSFDAGLVQRLVQETWYAEARNIVSRLRGRQNLY